MAGALIGGAALGAAFGELLSVIKNLGERAINFNPVLKEIQSKIEAMSPLVDEIEGLNGALNFPKEETEKLRKLIEDGKELLLKCGNLKCLKKPFYTKKLRELNTAIESFRDILSMQTARDVKKTMKIVFEILHRLPTANDSIKPTELPQPIQSRRRPRPVSRRYLRPEDQPLGVQNLVKFGHPDPPAAAATNNTIKPTELSQPIQSRRRPLRPNDQPQGVTDLVNSGRPEPLAAAATNNSVTPIELSQPIQSRRRPRPVSRRFLRPEDQQLGVTNLVKSGCSDPLTAAATNNSLKPTELPQPIQSRPKPRICCFRRMDTPPI